MAVKSFVLLLPLNRARANAPQSISEIRLHLQVFSVSRFTVITKDPRPPPINGLCNSRLCRPRLRPLRLRPPCLCVSQQQQHHLLFTSISENHG